MFFRCEYCFLCLRRNTNEHEWRVNTLLPFQGVFAHGSIPRALPWAVSPSGLAFQAVSQASIIRIYSYLVSGGNKIKMLFLLFRLSSKRKFVFFVFLDVSIVFLPAAQHE